jgi:hypothetical protein
MQYNIQLRLRFVTAVFVVAFIVIGVRLAQFGDYPADSFVALFLETTAIYLLLLASKPLRQIWGKLTWNIFKVLNLNTAQAQHQNSVLVSFFNDRLNKTSVSKTLCVSATAQISIVGLFGGQPIVAAVLASILLIVLMLIIADEVLLLGRIMQGTYLEGESEVEEFFEWVSALRDQPPDDTSNATPIFPHPAVEPVGGVLVGGGTVAGSPRSRGDRA